METNMNEGEPDIEVQVTPDIVLANTYDPNVVLSPDVSVDLELQSELTTFETDMEVISLNAINNLLSTLGFQSKPAMSSQSGTSSQLVITTDESLIGEFRILASTTLLQYLLWKNLSTYLSKNSKLTSNSFLLLSLQTMVSSNLEDKVKTYHVCDQERSFKEQSDSQANLVG
ncbi:hypothetical protein L195_g006532 [Trifolium pratense]|uniref:Uncharacterized protein n=1 Tax=Trifolium pratense TaxID=57577 RepID=A0A2K3P3W6_TRIPR|nr:hypothetical protein L195_g006532 [Trifolium pratense]